LSFPLLENGHLESPGIARGRLAEGLPIELHAVDPSLYAETLHGLTGSEGHVRKLGRLAEARGLRSAPARSEGQLYARLGLSYVPPELREDAGEIEAALEGTLPEDLIESKDVVGLVHCHSVYSDGRNTIGEMARAADR